MNANRLKKVSLAADMDRQGKTPGSSIDETETGAFRHPFHEKKTAAKPVKTTP